MNAPPEAKTIVAVLDDLFFNVKIADAAKRVGATVRFVKSADAAVASLQEDPAVIVVDLNCAAIDPIELVKRLKSDENTRVNIIGFVSHVQADLRQRAQDAGYDMVLARSAFSSKLTEIFRGFVGI